MMNKSILLLTSLFLFHFVFGQGGDFSTVYQVKTGEIKLKWFPKKFETVQAVIDNGYTIARVENPNDGNPNNLNFTEAFSYSFASPKIDLKAAIDQKKLSDENSFVLDAFLGYGAAPDKNGKEFAFAMFTVQNTIDATLGQLAGFTLVDKKFDKKKKYTYRISVKGYTPFYITINASKPTTYPKIEELKLKLDQKNTVEIEWQSKLYTDFGFCFQIEKSIDKPKEGNYLFKVPYAPVTTSTEKKDKLDSYRDLDLQEGKFHYYRLIGLNYFGEYALFSDWKKIYVPNHVNAEVFIDSIYVKDLSRVVEGSAHSVGSKKMNVSKFVLEQSKLRNSEFQVINEFNAKDSTFRFVVPMLKTGDQYYYRVTAISSDLDSVSSNSDYFFTLDQEPPGPPSSLSAKIDSSGVVTLLWEGPKDKDIKGYRIFRANELSEEFQEMNKELSPATLYIDKVLLDNLTPEIYYFVRSVDNNYNNSAHSDTIIVIKPDTISPVVSFLNQPLIADSSIRLSWYNSNSIDLAENVLIRMNESKVDTLLKWSDTASFYIDFPEKLGDYYIYQILTTDKSDNLSIGEIRRVYFEQGWRKPLKEVQGIANRENKTIEITWNAPSEKVFSYLIYKAKGDEKLSLIKTLESPESLKFIDNNLKIGNQYTYYVKFITETGIHSLPSKNIVLVY